MPEATIGGAVDRSELRPLLRWQVVKDFCGTTSSSETPLAVFYRRKSCLSFHQQSRSPYRLTFDVDNMPSA